MIKIQIGKEKNLYKLRVKGHADSAPYGEDLICAGISTLTFTFIASLEEVLKLDKNSYYYSVGKNADIKVQVDLEKLEESLLGNFKLLTNFYETGLRGVIEGNEKFVKINTKEV